MSDNPLAAENDHWTGDPAVDRADLVDRAMAAIGQPNTPSIPNFRERKPCGNHLCKRDTSSGAVFCCAGCARADAGGYEIHESGPLGHSPDCNERHAERSG